MRNFYRKDWILFQEIANEGGKLPEELIEIKVKTDNPDTNKHVPFITEIKDGYTVRCGKTGLHDENNEHHIIFVDLIIDEVNVHRRYIKRGEVAEVTFLVPKGKTVQAAAFCNLHGLWTYTL